MEKSSVESGDEKPEAEVDNGQTIRPIRSPGTGLSPLPVSKPPATDIEPIAEDASDFDFAEDDDNLQAKVANFKVSVKHHTLITAVTEGFRRRSPFAVVYSTPMISRLSASCLHHQAQRRPRSRHSHTNPRDHH